MALMKQDIEEIGKALDSKLDIRLTPLESKLYERFSTIDNKLGVLEYKVDDTQKDVNGLREQIQRLTITLDNFVKMMTDNKEEFTILKAEVDQMKRIFKEKFGVEIAIQH